MTMTLSVAEPMLQAASHLPEIGLAELGEIGDLQTRVDRKYLLPASVAGQLLTDMTAPARVLVVDERRESHYRSLYFDTEAYDSYLSTAYRRRRRFKVRTRSYVDTGERMLEVKTRTGRGATVKWRAVHGGAAEDVLDGDDVGFVAETLCGAGVIGAGVTGTGAIGEVDIGLVRDGGALGDGGRAAGGAGPAADVPGAATVARVGDDDRAVATALGSASLAPVLATDYHRMTLSLTEPAARVTFDRGLVWHAVGRGVASADADGGADASDCSGVAVLPAAVGLVGTREAAGAVELADAVVVETKTERGPCAADHLLWRQGYRPVSLSKFGTGMALTRPGLPANRWHRLLASELRPRCVPVGPTTGE